MKFITFWLIVIALILPLPHVVTQLIFTVGLMLYGFWVFFDIRSFNCPIWQMPFGLACVIDGFAFSLIAIAKHYPHNHVGLIIDSGLVCVAILGSWLGFKLLMRL